MTRWVITLGAIVILVARLLFPDALQPFDQISLFLLALAALPWLSEIIGKVSIAGVGEIELRELSKKIDRTSEEAQTAKRIALASERNSEELFIEHLKMPFSQSSTEQDIEKLSEKYVSARSRLPKGDMRTSSMTAIFGQMVEAAKLLGPNHPVNRSWNSSDDAGQQLAWIAYAYSHPKRVNTKDLFALIERSNQSFIQYWGLRVIQRIIEQLGLSALSPDAVRRLRNLQDVVPASTDRFAVLAAINQTVKELLG